MYRWLAANNIKTSQVTIIPFSNPSAMVQALVQGNIDAMFAWEPYNYDVTNEIPALARSYLTPANLYSGRTTVVMNSSYLNSHLDIAKGIIEGLIKAVDYIHSNPNDAKKIVMARTGMSMNSLDALWNEYDYKVELDNGLQAILNNETSWIKSTGGDGANIGPSKIVNSKVLLVINSNKVGSDFKP